MEYCYGVGLCWHILHPVCFKIKHLVGGVEGGCESYGGGGVDGVCVGGTKFV